MKSRAVSQKGSFSLFPKKKKKTRVFEDGYSCPHTHPQLQRPHCAPNAPAPEEPAPQQLHVRREGCGEGREGFDSQKSTCGAEAKVSLLSQAVLHRPKLQKRLHGARARSGAVQGWEEAAGLVPCPAAPFPRWGRGAEALSSLRTPERAKPPAAPAPGKSRPARRARHCEGTSTGTGEGNTGQEGATKGSDLMIPLCPGCGTSLEGFKLGNSSVRESRSWLQPSLVLLLPDCVAFSPS